MVLYNKESINNFPQRSCRILVSPGALLTYIFQIFIYFSIRLRYSLILYYPVIWQYSLDKKMLKQVNLSLEGDSFISNCSIDTSTHEQWGGQPLKFKYGKYHIIKKII